MGEWKILGETVEEFMVRWNAVTFQLGGLSEAFAKRLALIYIKELETSLESYGLDLTSFFVNLSRGGSISTVKVTDTTTSSKIKEFYRHNLWGTSIPYAIPIALDMSPPLEGKTVLDIGCGFGRLSLLCALKRASRVVAIDLSEPLIQSLERTARILHLSNIETYIMDAENLNLESNQFDIIYCCEVIEHLPNPIKTLHSMHSLLKPTGSLILSTPNGLNMVGFKHSFLKLLHYDWTSPYGIGQPELRMFTPMTLRSLLSTCDFEIKTLRGAEFLDNLAIFYPGGFATGLLQFLPLLFPSIKRIKSELTRFERNRFAKNFGLEMFIRAFPLKTSKL